MKICISCSVKFATTGWQCPSCSSPPLQVDGYLSFAPEQARSCEGFQLITLQSWHMPKQRTSGFVLVSGYVLSGVAEANPQLEVSGSEIHSAGLNYAANRVKHAGLFQMNGRAIPFEDEFDVIGAFDVLEHIEEDVKVLAQIFRALSRGGGVIVKVPRHRFLWSQPDEYACHVRRYEAQELHDKVEQAGFWVERETSFVSVLLPLMFMSRLSKRKPVENYDATGELRRVAC